MTHVEWPIRIHYPDGPDEDFLAKDKRTLIGAVEYWPNWPGEEGQTERIDLLDANGRKLVGKINILEGVCDLHVEI